MIWKSRLEWWDFGRIGFLKPERCYNCWSHFQEVWNVMSGVSLKAAVNCSHWKTRWEVVNWHWHLCQFMKSVWIELWKFVFTLEGVVTPQQTWCFTPLSPSRDETDQWYSKEQRATMGYLALMDIKDWLWEHIDPCQELGATCDPWQGTYHWTTAFFWSCTHFDLGFKG